MSEMQEKVSTQVPEEPPRADLKSERVQVVFPIVFSGSHAGVPSGITDNQLDFASELG